MQTRVFQSRKEADAAAADLLAGSVTTAGANNLIVAGGNTPLPLYGYVASRGLHLSHLNIFVLDEYVGVPVEDPRTCTNLLLEKVVRAWQVPVERFHGLETHPDRALEAVRAHEEKLARAGGADVLVLGLGVNGHLGFNEPGSPADCPAHVRDLDPLSVEGNRQWFDGRYAPSRGATLGLRTLLRARRILLLAYGESKAAAVKSMVDGDIGSHCPASFLRAHPETTVFLDAASAAMLRSRANANDRSVE